MSMTYMKALEHVFFHGIEELNVRTGQKTKRVFGAAIEYADGRIFTPRECNPGISAAELAWMLSGTKSTEWLSKYTKIWKKFEDATGIIRTAYGYRWRYAFGRDQLSEAVELLKKDPSSRQVLVMSWHPGEDGLANQGLSKNVPCPFAFQFLISNGSLKVIVYQRSADLVAGVPYDLMTYWMLGKAVAEQVGTMFAGVTILFGDLHIYESHYAVAERMLRCEDLPHQGSLLAVKGLDVMKKDPDAFVVANWKLWEGLFEVREKVEVAQ